MSFFSFVLLAGMFSASICLVMAAIVSFMLADLDDELLHRERVLGYVRRNVRAACYIWCLSFGAAILGIALYGWQLAKASLFLIHALLLLSSAVWLVVLLRRKT